MRIGTKSVLYGVHAFYLHPFFVALSWFKLYGLREVVWEPWEGALPHRVRWWSPWLWLSFLLHDIGYLGKPNMDGPEGEEHPLVGADIVAALREKVGTVEDGASWWGFIYFHSRFLAKRADVRPSPLCMADKLAIALTPAWIYLPMARATGEVYEYMRDTRQNAEAGEPQNISTATMAMWFAGVQSYCRAWVEKHKEGGDDTWTPVRKRPKDWTGVWK